MYRNSSSRALRLAATALALGVSGIALADDGSMSRLTGDSYAYFNNLDYRPGAFSVAKAAQSPMAVLPAAKDEPTAERRIMLAVPRLAITPPAAFDDSKGA